MILFCHIIRRFEQRMKYRIESMLGTDSTDESVPIFFRAYPLDAFNYYYCRLPSSFLSFLMYAVMIRSTELIPCFFVSYFPFACFKLDLEGQYVYYILWLQDFNSCLVIYELVWPSSFSCQSLDLFVFTLFSHTVIPPFPLSSLNFSLSSEYDIS
ncbi:hypothetical protein BJX99DRAFT_20046 [Aspergillus californicus]